jgi:ATP-dependent DNA helicase RecG
LTINQKKILELIKMNKSVSMTQMAVEIGISKRKILDNINKLKSINLLERVGSTKAGFWKVDDKTSEK